MRRDFPPCQLNWEKLPISVPPTIAQQLIPFHLSVFFHWVIEWVKNGPRELGLIKSHLMVAVQAVVLAFASHHNCFGASSPHLDGGLWLHSDPPTLDKGWIVKQEPPFSFVLAKISITNDVISKHLVHSLFHHYYGGGSIFLSAVFLYPLNLCSLHACPLLPCRTRMPRIKRCTASPPCPQLRLSPPPQSTASSCLG